MIDLPPDRNSGPRFAEFAHPEAAQPASSIQRRKSAGRETAAFGWESVPSQDRGARAGSSFSFPPDMRERRFRRGIPPEAPCRRKSSTAGAAGIKLPQCRGEWELEHGAGFRTMLSSSAIPELLAASRALLQLRGAGTRPCTREFRQLLKLCRVEICV